MRRSHQFVGRARVIAIILAVVLVAAGPDADARNDTSTAPRDIVENDDLIVEGSLCASDDDLCIDGESFVGPAGLPEIKAKDNFPSMWFDSTQPTDPDWEIGVGLAGTDFGRFQLATAAAVVPVAVTYDALDDSLVIDADGVGIGVANPDRPLRIEGDPATGSVVKAEHTGLTTELRTVFSLENNGPPGFRLLDNSPGGANWIFRGSNSGAFSISENDSGLVEFRLVPGGNLTIGGSLTQGSSEANKDDIESVDVDQVLAGVNALDISTWSYLQAPNTTHIGPMAEDFFATFDLGHGPDGITTVDADGVALAAIQALSAENDALRAELDAVLDRLEALEAS